MHTLHPTVYTSTDSNAANTQLFHSQHTPQRPVIHSYQSSATIGTSSTVTAANIFDLERDTDGEVSSSRSGSDSDLSSARRSTPVDMNHVVMTSTSAAAARDLKLDDRFASLNIARHVITTHSPKQSDKSCRARPSTPKLRVFKCDDESCRYRVGIARDGEIEKWSINLIYVTTYSTAFVSATSPPYQHG